MAGMILARLSFRPLHNELDLHCSCFLEQERRLELLTFDGPIYGLDQHYVGSTRLKRQGSTGGNFEALLRRTHFRYPFHQGGLVDFQSLGDVSRATDKTVRLLSGIDDRHIATQHRSDRRSQCRPRIA